MVRPKGGPGLCKGCQKEKDYIHLSGKSAGLCKRCYVNLIWARKFITCKRCKRERYHQAFGLCMGCYNSVFQIENVKIQNIMKDHNIDYETYKRLTTQCFLCGFDKIVELHHLDHNKKNNSSDNLIGVCPNHHKMIHNRKFSQEIYEELKGKGFSPKQPYENDDIFKR